MATLDPYVDHPNAESILQEGWILFQQKGYLGVSVDDVCQRSGVTKPTLYYYFQNKENLFVQVVLRQLNHFRQAGDGRGTLQDRLYRVAKTILDSLDTELVVLYHNLEHLAEPARYQLKEALRTELMQPLATLMSSGIEAGRLRPGDPFFYARLFIGIVNTFVARSPDSTSDREALARQMVTFFLRGAGWADTSIR